MFSFFYQNIVFEGFEEQVKEVTGDEEWEKDPNDIEMDDIEPMDISPWAGTDRDYSYEEVRTPLCHPTVYSIDSTYA